MAAMQWSSTGESGAVTFLEFLEQRRQYGGSLDLPAVLLAPAVCGHCGKLENLRRDWNTYSHNGGSAAKNHELTVPDLYGSLADQIPQIAFEGNTCFTCVKTIFEATQWIDGGDHRCNTPLHYAARSGNLRMLFHLICQLGDYYGHEWTALVLRKLNVHGETALHEAIRLGRSKCMVGMLMWVDPGLARHHAADLPGAASPLYLAVSLGHKHIAEMLHSTSGGNLSYSGPDGQNALHAAIHRPYGMIEMLLDWNKDLCNEKDQNGSTPLHSMVSAQSEDYIPRCSFHFPYIRWSPLEKHATRRVLDANPSAAYEHDKNGLLPVHVAALMGRKVPIRILLERCGGCIALPDRQGRSFLHIAVKTKVHSIVNYACQEPVFVPILNSRDNDGNTALHLAVELENLSMFCYLLRNPEVQLNVRNNKDQTPLDLARSKGKRRPTFSYGLSPAIVIYRTLIDAGARYGSFWRDRVQQRCIENQLSSLKDGENQSKEVVEANHKKKEKKEKKKSDEVTESNRTLGILSVLIATVTFGAAFAVPAAVKEGDNSNGGIPRVFGAWYFGVFMIANGLAFVYSSIATLCLMISGTSMVKLHIRRFCFLASAFLASHSLTYLTIAFALGVHIVLAPAGRTISGCIYIMSSLFVFCQNAGFVSEICYTYKPLSVRRGHKFVCWLFIRRISLWVIVHFWPFMFFTTAGSSKPVP